MGGLPAHFRTGNLFVSLGRGPNAQTEPGKSPWLGNFLTAMPKDDSDEQASVNSGMNLKSQERASASQQSGDPNRLTQSLPNLSSDPKSTGSSTKGPNPAAQATSNSLPGGMDDTIESVQPRPVQSDASKTAFAVASLPTTPQATSTGNPPAGAPGVVVETEIVPSVPTLAVSTANSLRVKRSQDSVPRPHPSRGVTSPPATAAAGQQLMAASRKRSLRMGQGSKADIFAAKVASAVDEAHNSSDSDETFVYDRPSRDQSQDRAAGGDDLGHSGSGAEAPRELARDGTSQPFRRQFYRTTSMSSLSTREGQPATQSNGNGNQFGLAGSSGEMPPPPRAFVAYNPRRPDSQRAKNTYLQRWRTIPSATAPSLDDDDDEDDDTDHNDSGHHNGASYAISSKQRTGFQTSAAAAAAAAERQRLYPSAPPGMYTYLPDSVSPHDYVSPKRFETPLVVRVTLWMVSLLIGLLSVVLVVGLGYVASRPLKDLDVITLSDVFTSDQELVFSMVLRARNPGLLTVNVERAELDVFATTKWLETAEKGRRTILLGTIHELDSPVSFSGSFLNPSSEWQTASVKLIDPAENGTEWANIIEHPFELTVKGTLRYRLWLHGEVRAGISIAAPVAPPGGSFRNEIDQNPIHLI